jgi:hypothetical protein
MPAQILAHSMIGYTLKGVMLTQASLAKGRRPPRGQMGLHSTPARSSGSCAGNQGCNSLLSEGAPLPVMIRSWLGN